MLRAWASQALIVLMTVAVGPGGDARAQAIAPQKEAESGESQSKDSGPAKPGKRTDPAEVQNALDQAAKVLEGGKADQTIQRINSLLADARLQGRSMARALYLRGAAHHKQGKPAQAIADLTSALWLKGGLSDADRLAATALRSQAYREAGLNDLADADARKADRGLVASTNSAAWQTDTAARSARSARTSEPEPKVAAAVSKQSGTGGLAGFFSNLFGASPPAQSATAGSNEARPDPYRAASPRQPSVGEAWSTSVDPRAPGSARQAASIRQETAALPAREETPAVKPATAPPKAQGRYRLQVAAVRSNSEAQAVAARLKKEYAAALGGREPAVDETVIGNMGTFYRVRIGPFADAHEPGALCTKLRGIGLDCLIMTE